MRSISIRAVARLAPFALVAACRGSADEDLTTQRARLAAERGRDVTVAVVWPWQARRDLHFEQGLDLALDELNAGGGVAGRHVRLQKLDDHESVDEGRRIAQTIARDPNVVAVIGHLQSYVSVPAAGIYDLAGLVMIAPTATTPELTQAGYRRVFRTTFTDLAVGQRMARLALARNYRHLAIYYVRNEYGRSLANAFEEQATAGGAQVLDRQSYDAGAEFSVAGAEQTVAAWKGLPIDAIFIAGQVPQAAQFVAELRRRGITVPLLGGDALGTTSLIDVAGPAAEGAAIAAAFHPDQPGPEVARFDAAFRARYGTTPDVGAAAAYDALGVLGAAMRRARSAVPDSVAAALHAMHDWRGVTGLLAFDARGDRVNPLVNTIVVRNGRFEYFDDAAATRVAAAGSVTR